MSRVDCLSVGGKSRLAVSASRQRPLVLGVRRVGRLRAANVPAFSCPRTAAVPLFPPIGKLVLHLNGQRKSPHPTVGHRLETRHKRLRLIRDSAVTLPLGQGGTCGPATGLPPPLGPSPRASPAACASRDRRPRRHPQSPTSSSHRDPGGTSKPPARDPRGCSGRYRNFAGTLPEPFRPSSLPPAPAKGLGRWKVSLVPNGTPS